jgi:hypothetical protein
MKSPLLDRSKQTSCKECIFAKYEDKTQIGCVANRIIKFQNLNNVIEAYDDDKEFYVINGFCNYYRNQQWNDGVANIDRAKKESSLTFDIFINCDDINEEYKNKIKTFLSTINYDENKLNIVLYHLDRLRNDLREYVLDIYKNYKKIKISVCFNKNSFLHESILKSNSSFYLSLSKDSFIGPYILNHINNLINDDIKKFIVANDGGVLIVSNIAYRMQFLNTENADHEENVEQVIKKAKEFTLYAEITNEE